MSTPSRIQVKLFFTQDTDVPIKAFVPVFHRWIQQQAMDDLLIDVHNYSHIPRGPGILLVAHESDFSIDSGAGRVGLLYRRKRLNPDTFPELLKLALRQAIRGALLLQQDESLPGGVRFQGNEIEISIPDRLKYPNNIATFERLQPDLQRLADDLYGEGKAAAELISNDPREPLVVRVKALEAPSLPVLAGKLQIAEPV